MNLGLKDRVAVVAASSQGLGKAVAMALAREGAKLAICARTASAISAAADEIRAATGADVLAPRMSPSMNPSAGSSPRLWNGSGALISV
jgi:NAD(P)-dependent dehydrogenase (short-subunit alcohol dehydrogenase family)